MALITRSSPWPMFTHINWLLKSRNRLPSGVQKYTPFARATGIGSTAFCADHSKIVCRFDSATMSAPVIGPVIVLVIHHIPIEAFCGRSDDCFGRRSDRR